MRELVHVQLGQAGNHIGSKFYELIAEEHGILPDGSAPGATSLQLERANVYFADGAAGRFVPRAILVDTEPGSLDNVRSSLYGSLFGPDDYVYGQGGTGNNWAKGHYTEGSEILDPVLDVVRRKAENCDMLHGFQICNSLGGGTGSGLGTLVMNKLREEYPAEIMATFSVVPSPKVSDTVVEPYNTMLSFSQLIENADEVFVLDNEALYDICVKRLRLNMPTYGDLNHLICSAMSNTTSCFRFPGQPNTDLRKIGVNLIPFPRIHFFSIGMAPLLSRGAQVFESLSTAELIRACFNPRNAMCAINSSGSQIASCAIFRGKSLSMLHIQEQMCQLVNSNSANFIEWIPDNCMTCVCEVPSKGLLSSCTAIINSTSIQHVFARVRAQFVPMLKRKAFLHWYTGEGMDEAEFVQAEVNVSDLISEYQQYESRSDDAGKYISDYEKSDDDEPEQEDNLK